MKEGVIRIVCSESLAPAFSLAGLSAHPAETPQEAQRVISTLSASDDSVAFVFVEQSLLGENAQDMGRSASSSPTLVPFPGPVWAGMPPTESYVAEILRRAVGYRVKT